ncbi:hypothetical protein RUMOBE_03359 [Blautia obeum ATCC 29174]|uniref:Uncharacterized protein n=1 Tax=Blautia obeum ATCC 29174 TaxID=411459 RepID=A5ZWG6_9FIRM|nr:hypothetical protein RUMOBE_03359 [Blautia obeum ATCC 29174]
MIFHYRIVIVMLSGVFCVLWCKHRYGKVRKDLYEEKETCDFQGSSGKYR